MRVRNNFKENKEQELKDKITATLLVTAIAVTPAAIVHKVDQAQIDTMMNYYETIIEEEREKAYLQGFLDGIFGVEDNYYTPVEDENNNIIESKDLIIKLPEKEEGKKLVYSMKNVKF